MKILVTGAAGYIGSHTALCLLENGYEVIGFDNFSNSKYEAIKRVEKLTGKQITFYEGDMLKIEDLENVFSHEHIDAVIHFAALKAVGESVSKPLQYYTNNLSGTLNVLNIMSKYQVNSFVFSSSATVYGNPKTLPITEDFDLSTTNPYGATKLMIEDIIRDYVKANKKLNVAILRYFNPVGAHKSGLIGENPNGVPNNLVPYITQVIVGKREFLSIYGNDYNTIDGTGVRDYIHVCDLANGHILALEKLQTNPGLLTYNLGTGNGVSVLEMVHSFEHVCGKTIPYKILERRTGDIDSCYADCQKACTELGFVAKYNLNDMCTDSYRWQINNPNGYED